MLVENQDLQNRYYKALVERDKNFDGLFFAAIKTTGVFCHATCRARKPKFENCLFYTEAESALLAGFRPCKICCPLSYPQDLPEDVQRLVEAVEAHPEKRWTEEDFRQLGIHSATARRKFKSIYQMTFIQYARARRMGLAFKELQSGSRVIDQQIAQGYQSASGFQDAFASIMGTSPSRQDMVVLTACFLATPLGRLFAIADEDFLYLLEFDNRRGLEREIEKLRTKWNARLIHGSNPLLQQLKRELEAYFKGELTQFKTPVYMAGSPFQRAVWTLLQEIPIGQTRSYKDLAESLGDANKVRAVGNANGANQISILIPCHRVIASDGSLGGYGGGTERKQYLLDLESKIAEKKPRQSEDSD